MNRFSSSVALAIVLVISGCVPPEEAGCNAALCDGCCQAGVCVGGNTSGSCGSGGTECRACTGSTSACLAGVCVAPVTPQHDGGMPRDAGSSCQSPTDEAFCRALGACGAVSAPDVCGVERTVNCSCECQSPTDQGFCQSHGATCGQVDDFDACSVRRKVQCGTCTSAQSCVANSCVCQPETNAQLCAAASRACGSLSVKDRCGTTRNIANCGNCSSNNQCNQGICACSGESDGSFCSRKGASCGTISGTDLCGNPKSVANCGTCSGTNECGGGGVNNVCGCTRKRDTELCASESLECGSTYVTDNCGRSHYVPSCGTCSAPETCGVFNANQCECKAETDTQFCTRLGKNCGSVTAANNCGVMRAVSCGACGSDTTCGGAGTPNVCGCTADTDAQLCERFEFNCGAYATIDRCGASRQTTCGTCTGDHVCGASGFNNRCISPAVLTADSLNHHAVTLAPPFIGEGIVAIRATSPTETWLATETNVIRVRPGGSVQPYFPSGSSRNQLRRFWSSSPSDVWLASGSTLSHFDGTAWAQVPTTGSNYSLDDLTGRGPNNLWVLQGGAVRHFDGMVWSNWADPIGSGNLWSMVLQLDGTPIVNQAGTLYRWNGLSYVVMPKPRGITGSGSYFYTSTRSWTSPQGTLFNATFACDWYWDSDVLIEKFDGTQWVVVSQLHGGPYCATTYKATFDGWGENTMLTGTSWNTGQLRVGSQTIALSGPLVSARGEASGVAANGTQVFAVDARGPGQVFDAGVAPDCSKTYVNGDGGALLVCGGRIAEVDSFNRFSTVPNSSVAAVHVSPSSSLWAALANGSIEKRASSGTTAFNGYLGSVFVAISATSDTNVWAVTGEGGALHYDGANWSPTLVPIASTATLLGVDAAGPWAWSNSALFKWSGSAWQPVALPMTMTIRDVVSANGVLWIRSQVSGQPKPFAIHSLNGTTWKLQRTTDVGDVMLGGGVLGVITLTLGPGPVGTIEKWAETGPTTLGTLIDFSLEGGKGLMAVRLNALIYNSDHKVYLAPF